MIAAMAEATPDTLIEGDPTGIAAAARRFGRAALDLVLPPRCLHCGIPVTGTVALCADCWSQVTFLGPPQCACCGRPFAEPAPPETLCGACLAQRPLYARARAVFRYDDASKGLIIAFKHGDRTDSVPALAQWLARAGETLIEDADLIVPVPLHWTRLFQRRFNQAAMLALALGRQSGKPVLPDALERRKRTPPQGRSSRDQRRRNVAGAFAVQRKHRPLVADRRVLLIDDVLTTGATIEACSRALLGAGASSIDVLTLARVVRGETGGG
ncbi:MAG: ComF family protein [Rhodospirillaceae bacterium]|nr:ComF family protein [Rhodospirillaceae bacterium]